MGQQMGKQAELPLICSTESLATPKEEEGGRQWDRSGVLIFLAQIATTVLFSFNPNRVFRSFTDNLHSFSTTSFALQKITIFYKKIALV